MDTDFIHLAVLPVAFTVAALAMRGTSDLAYWSGAATLSFGFLAMLSILSRTTPEGAAAGFIVLGAPLGAIFGVVRLNAVRSRPVVALLVGPLSYLSVLVVGLTVGVNLGWLRP